ncbi:hypothetical protein [Patulibacter defluvii]|nr:hypothetical protein [Patulibacter sp. DM4]
MIRTIVTAIGSGFLELGRLGSAQPAPTRGRSAHEQHPQPPRPVA